MLRRRLGDDAFWKSIQRYGNEHRLQSVETTDFRRTLERQTGRDLEHFFHDWTERPGSPALEVTTEFTADPNQARVVLKQTQSGEPFRFPLKLAFQCEGTEKPVVVQQPIADKEYTFLVPLPGRLTRIDVDPDYTILMELKETKGRELWESQLLQGPNVPARIRAVRHFTRSKEKADQQLLAKAFGVEKFWGVRSELASALGEMGGDYCRDALLTGLHDPDAKVRRACVNQLGKFISDAKVVSAIQAILKDGDPSYSVQAAALEVYAREPRKDTVALIVPWLSRPSRHDTLRSGALAALARTGDPAAFDPLMEWAGPGHPRNSRASAIRGLTQLARKAKLTDEQHRQIMKTVSAALESDDRRLCMTVLFSIRDLGSAAKEVLPAVEKISRDDPNEQIRNMARQTAEQIGGKAPAAPVSPEVKQLRDEVEQLKRERDSLREQLKKLEKAGTKN
jgi:aminopeptidase N